MNIKHRIICTKSKYPRVNWLNGSVIDSNVLVQFVSIRFKLKFLINLLEKNYFCVISDSWKNFNSCLVYRVWHIFNVQVQARWQLDIQQNFFYRSFYAKIRKIQIISLNNIISLPAFQITWKIKSSVILLPTFIIY